MRKIKAYRRAGCPPPGSVVVVTGDPPPDRGQPAIQPYREVPHRIKLNCESIRRTGSTSVFFVGSKTRRTATNCASAQPYRRRTLSIQDAHSWLFAQQRRAQILHNRRRDIQLRPCGGGRGTTRERRTDMAPALGRASLAGTCLVRSPSGPKGYAGRAARCRGAGFQTGTCCGVAFQC